MEFLLKNFTKAIAYCIAKVHFGYCETFYCLPKFLYRRAVYHLRYFRKIFVCIVNHFFASQYTNEQGRQNSIKVNGADNIKFPEKQKKQQPKVIFYIK